jgi:PHD/YefM family antitoxin component YafN of YafNO toxin-antitoxin module
VIKIIPPEAYERLAAMENCLERLTKGASDADAELADKVRRMTELTAELRAVLLRIDRTGEEAT